MEYWRNVFQTMVQRNREKNGGEIVIGATKHVERIKMIREENSKGGIKSNQIERKRSKDDLNSGGESSMESRTQKNSRSAQKSPSKYERNMQGPDYKEEGARLSNPTKVEYNVPGDTQNQ